MRAATGDLRPATRHTAHLLTLLSVGCWLLVAGCSLAEAAVSKGRDKEIEVASVSQAGGAATSANFRQQVSVGEPMATHRVTSSRFQIIPGFLGGAFSSLTGKTVPVSELDLTVLYAKTDPLGLEIAARTWQKDNDPIFIWEPPPTGAEVAGYSYALDATPDDVIDGTGTSLNVAASSPNTLTDGPHTFSVKAVNSAGHGGNPLSIELWVDTTPPQIVSYSPASGALLKTLRPTVSATLSDPHSGVKASSVSIIVNGSAISSVVDPATGVMTATGGSWKEGANSLELHVADAAGNTLAPLLWSVTIDTLPPAGTILINGGAEMTTSAYVTLGLEASDATSGISTMLVSNDELTGYVEEPYVTLREFWQLTPVRGIRTVYVKFVDVAGNVSAPVSDEIELGLLSPETMITSGPAGVTPSRTATFAFMCPEGGCLFSYSFDKGEWSNWSSSTSAEQTGLSVGNHYFWVKAAKDVNGTPGIQPNEEDPSPAARTWTVGVEPSMLVVPKGPPIKVWRLE